MVGLTSLSWSSPTRRNSNGQELSIIPNEIYTEIMDYLEPSERISSAEHKLLMSKMSRVCRFFCSIALPRMCQTLEMVFFHAKQPVEDGWERSTQFTVKLFQALNNPKTPKESLPFELASQVKKCSVTFFDPFHGVRPVYPQDYWTTEEIELGKWRNSFLEEFLRGMGKMPNLQSLHVEGELSELAIARISKLSSLKSLRIGPLCVDEEDGSLSALSPLHLDSLALDWDPYGSRVHILSGHDVLSKFFRPHTKLVRLTSPAVPFMPRGSQLRRLEIMEIWSSGLSELFAILREDLALEELIVHEIQLDRFGVENRMLDNPLPLHRLKVLNCPVEPVILQIDTTSGKKSVLRDLSLRVVRNTPGRFLKGKLRAMIDPDVLKRLRVDKEVFRIIFKEHTEVIEFGALEELEVGFENIYGVMRVLDVSSKNDEVFRPIKTLAARFPNLRRLRLTHNHRIVLMDLQYQKVQIDILANALPLLERVSMDDVIIWDVVDGHEREFLPFIPWNRSQLMKERIIESSYMMVDYRGCFERLTGNSESTSTS